MLEVDQEQEPFIPPPPTGLEKYHYCEHPYDEQEEEESLEIDDVGSVTASTPQTQSPTVEESNPRGGEQVPDDVSECSTLPPEPDFTAALESQASQWIAKTKSK